MVNATVPVASEPERVLDACHERPDHVTIAGFHTIVTTTPVSVLVHVKLSVTVSPDFARLPEALSEVICTVERVGIHGAVIVTVF